MRRPCSIARYYSCSMHRRLSEISSRQCTGQHMSTSSNPARSRLNGSGLKRLELNDRANFRLTAWNCNMALHRKLDALESLGADIAVLPEVAHPYVVAGKSPRFIADRCVWEGHNQHKGLGIVASSERWHMRLHESYDPGNAIILPVSVDGPLRFNLLAIWSLHVDGKKATARSGGPVVRALENAREFCRGAPLVVAGDFNNSVIWDKPGNVNNMTAIDDLLQDLGLVSAYHHSRNLALGAETDPTLYWRDRRIDGPRYHIDYIYIPRDWSGVKYSLQVGRFERWVGSGLSDHVPLTISFPLEALQS